MRVMSKSQNTHETVTRQSQAYHQKKSSRLQMRILLFNRLRYAWKDIMTSVIVYNVLFKVLMSEAIFLSWKIKHIPCFISIRLVCTFRLMILKDTIFYRPGVAGAVLQIALSLICLLIQTNRPFSSIFKKSPKLLELRPWTFDTMFTILVVSCATRHTCLMSDDIITPKLLELNDKFRTCNYKKWQSPELATPKLTRVVDFAIFGGGKS